jgi:hypothetical protein
MLTEQSTAPPRLDAIQTPKITKNESSLHPPSPLSPHHFSPSDPSLPRVSSSIMHTHYPWLDILESPTLVWSEIVHNGGIVA